MSGKGSFFIETYGCQMNERDSEIMAHLLAKAGLAQAAKLDDASVAVVNTCHIREHASQRALSFLGRLREWRAAEPGRVTVFAGCVAEAEGRGLLSRFPHLDVLLGPARLLDLPALVEAARNGAPPCVATGGAAERGVPEAQVPAEGGVRARLKIMEGCDRRCTFCVVPSVRGRERHRPFAEIVAEAERLVTEGVREIQLLGQAVNAYGKSAGPEGDFAALLLALGGNRGLARLRFTSSHPAFMSGRQLAAMRDGQAVAPHLHLPVQSGSDGILRRMGRGHTSAEYLARAEEARKTVPGLVLTTDFIVGFPGESPADFAATLDLVRAASFEGAYTFKYSPRPGTPAAAFPGAVPEEEKEERLAKLNVVLDGQSRRYNESLVGTRGEVLVEGPAEDGKAWQGRLPSNRLVLFGRGDAEPGQLREVVVTSAGTWTLQGELAPAREKVRA